MKIIQTVYCSRPFGFDAATLSNILNKARSRNEREGITGALICRRDIYLQLLEGPEASVEAAFERIEADDRHLEVTRLLSHSDVERLFPDWAMRDDPAQSWMWTPEQIEAGAAVKASEADVMGVFSRLAGLDPVSH